jgi:hypothetical protein
VFGLDQSPVRGATNHDVAEYFSWCCRPQILELKDDWPFLWFENEYVVDSATMFILAANAANALTK